MSKPDKDTLVIIGLVLFIGVTIIGSAVVGIVKFLAYWRVAFDVL